MCTGFDLTVADLEFYEAFVFFRGAAILQGVYKRAVSGQSSSSTGQFAGALAEAIANIGWDIAQRSGIPPNNIKPNPTSSSSSKPVSGVRTFSTMSQASHYSTSRDREIPGALPMSPSALSPRAYDLYQRVRKFIEDKVVPAEEEIHKLGLDPKLKWTIHPKLEELKKEARSQGLWNLFIPLDTDPKCEFGAGLTNLEYAFMCEEMGRHPISSEVFNCSAPDTGNMEVLARYGSPDIQKRFLTPLLNGEIRSCFGMTEPAVASSDATNIQSSIRREGNEYVINGHKWWTSGAMDPRCKVCIFMGKTRTDGAIHTQQSMIVVPMDAPGVKIVRPLTVFGYEDAPHGHAEVLFEDVRVPADYLLLGEGRGFEIAQGRLGPGRIHHCMRTIGMAERALALMVDRVQNRVAFGKPLAAQASIQQDIAKSRIEIEQCRLLVLKAAHMMDTVGNKVAAPEIAMIKVACPNMALRVIDRAIQAHGGMGVCQDTFLANAYSWQRVLRLADGPDEVHMRSLCKMEIRKQNQAKL
jgi:acyl-CoA dehydrogenase family protein 10